MCLFPQAFSLIFCLEFFKKCHVACSVQGTESVLMAKIKVPSQSLQIITGPINPRSLSFHKICILPGDFNRNLKHDGVILFSVYSDDMCNIQLDTGCLGFGTMSKIAVTVMIS